MKFIEIWIDILISIKSKLKVQTPLIRFLYIMFIASLIFLSTALKADAKRGARYQDTEGEEVGFYQESYALVIGASAYRKGWPKLPGVVDDIKTVSKALKMHDFVVTIIRDPDHGKLKSAINDFINRYGHDTNNRLLFYFAGHGHTIHLSYGADMGYIVPVDAPDPDVDKSGFLAKALDMQQFEVYARRIESKHALFLFDSCFSGSIFALERAIPKHISYKTARPVRQFITSGSADETVPDKSIFRHQFLEALDGEADVNEDGYITASELGEFLFEKVVNYSRGTQHPQYGKIRDMYLDKGDFVFLLASSGAVVEKLSKTESQAILSVESNVTGARVLVDGRAVGSTNLSDTEISPGEHRIRVEKEGYKPYVKKVRFAKGRAVSLYVDLNRKSPPKGKLHVYTEPEDARVRILNIKPKFSQGMELEPGNYHVEVAAEGYEIQRRWIDLGAGHEEPFKFELSKKEVVKSGGAHKKKFTAVRLKVKTRKNGTMDNPIFELYGGELQTPGQPLISKVLDNPNDLQPLREDVYKFDVPYEFCSIKTWSLKKPAGSSGDDQWHLDEIYLYLDEQLVYLDRVYGRNHGLITASSKPAGSWTGTAIYRHLCK